MDSTNEHFQTASKKKPSSKNTGKRRNKNDKFVMKLSKDKAAEYSTFPVPVAFQLDSENPLFGDFKSTIIPNKFINTIKGQNYVLGAAVSNKNNLFTIEFQHTQMESTIIPINLFLAASQLSVSLQMYNNRTSTGMFPISNNVEKYLFQTSEDDEGDAIPSDIEDDDETLADEVTGGAPQKYVFNESDILPEDGEFTFPSLETDDFTNIEEDGLEWELNGSVASPHNVYDGPPSYIPKKFKCHFNTPLSSFLAFFPIELWKIVVVETNKYAKWSHDTFGTFRSWKPTDLRELMAFVSLLIRMTLYPTPGQPFDCCWKYSDYMPIARFKSLRAAFHMSENGNREKITKDTFYKVRPLLNTIKINCGKYIIPGRDLAIDESSVACRSKYGRFLIFYNPSKPTGKYHFRLYLLYE